MEIFDKIKNGLISFSKMLSSVDVPDIDNPNEELSNELKEQLALADGFACETADMIKHKKEKKPFTASFNNKTVAKERKEPSKIINKDKKEPSKVVNKDEKERDDGRR